MFKWFHLLFFLLFFVLFFLLFTLLFSNHHLILSTTFIHRDNFSQSLSYIKILTIQYIFIMQRIYFLCLLHLIFSDLFSVLFFPFLWPQMVIWLLGYSQVVSIILCKFIKWRIKPNNSEESYVPPDSQSPQTRGLEFDLRSFNAHSFLFSMHSAEDF